MTDSRDDLRQRVIAHFQNRCAYCHAPFALFPAARQLDHIIPRSAMGSDEDENLCICCIGCNLHKAARVIGVDPLSGIVSRMYHPRRDRWSEHFAWELRGLRVVGLTPVGRATVVALQMNDSELVAARQIWVNIGWHPPADDPRLE
jgi:hypothetical protein